MTRKDYELIAKVIADEIALLDIGIRDVMVGTYRQQKWGATLIANALAKELKNDNPRFDHDKFIQACGF